MEVFPPVEVGTFPPHLKVGGEGDVMKINGLTHLTYLPPLFCKLL